MKRCIHGILAAVGLMVLILDTRTAVNGIEKGLEVCMNSAIPSLLPFLILSKYLSGSIMGARIPVLCRVAKFCGIPAGLESILGIGMVGGYPVGAQAAADAYQQGIIDRQTAERLLGFCNNAGPAFVFGISVSLFSNPGIGWIILLIQILSAICTGMLIPKKRNTEHQKISGNPISLARSVESGMRSMAMICGWILCFRVVLAYAEQYLSLNSPLIYVLFSGFLELSNGCIGLSKLNSEALRFILMNGMLSFGGICVWMQTRAVVKGLGIKWFVTGKFLQSTISITLAMILHTWLYPGNVIENYLLKILLCFGIIAAEILCINRKIIVASWRKVLYNNQKKFEMSDQHAVSQTD